MYSPRPTTSKQPWWNLLSKRAYGWNCWTRGLEEASEGIIEVDLQCLLHQALRPFHHSGFCHLKKVNSKKPNNPIPSMPTTTVLHKCSLSLPEDYCEGGNSSYSWVSLSSTGANRMSMHCITNLLETDRSINNWNHLTAKKRSSRIAPSWRTHAVTALLLHRRKKTAHNMNDESRFKDWLIIMNQWTAVLCQNALQ